MRKSSLNNKAHKHVSLDSLLFSNKKVKTNTTPTEDKVRMINKVGKSNSNYKHNNLIMTTSLKPELKKKVGNRRKSQRRVTKLKKAPNVIKPIQKEKLKYNPFLGIYVPENSYLTHFNNFDETKQAKQTKKTKQTKQTKQLSSNKQNIKQAKRILLENKDTIKINKTNSKLTQMIKPSLVLGVKKESADEKKLDEEIYELRNELYKKKKQIKQTKETKQDKYTKQDKTNHVISKPMTLKQYQQLSKKKKLNKKHLSLNSQGKIYSLINL